MPVNVQREERRLREMSVHELRVVYAEVYGNETKNVNKRFLIKRILWRMQCNEQGDISERARQRALEIANDADLRLRDYSARSKEPTTTVTKAPAALRDPRIPRIGTVLARKYKGELIEVDIEPGGFRYEGKLYPSLTAVAKEVTGGHWNGFRFFGLDDKGDEA